MRQNPYQQALTAERNANDHTDLRITEVLGAPIEDLETLQQLGLALTDNDSDIAAINSEMTKKAIKARRVNTTGPLTGGGTLEQDLNISIKDATTAQKGAVQLNNTVTSTSTVLALTARMGKQVWDKAVAAYNLANGKWTHRSATTSQTGTTQLSDSTTLSSSTLASTAKATKTTMNKAVEALNLAKTKITQASADGRYWKRTEKVADSSKLNGFGLTTAATTNTVAMRNGSGDLFTRLFRSSYGNSGSISGALAFRVNSSSDNYIRFCSNITAIKDWLSAASKPTHHYTTGNITLTRASQFTYVSRWGAGAGTITIDGSSFQKGDRIIISNIRDDSGKATMTCNDGTIYIPNGSSGATHTLTGRGVVVLEKYASNSNHLMVVSVH